MIRQLLFIAALLAPGLAYGGTATNTLNAPQVVDPPGSAPQAPAPAAAAGFTTCVVCMDFTAPSGGVWFNGAAVSGANGAQTNTWLDCAGASSPIWFAGSGGGLGRGSLPCPDITSDGAGNPLTLHFTNAVGGSVPPRDANSIVSYNPSTRAGVGVPTNNYFEATYWVQSFPVVSNFYGYNWAQWLGGSGEIPNNVHNFLEFDSNEINENPHVCGGQSSNMGSWAAATPGTGAGGTALGSNWYSACPPKSPTYDATSGYHTIGMRTTSDGTHLYKCAWIDGVLQNCVNATVNNAGFYSWQLTDAYSRMQAYISGAQNPTSVTQPQAYVTYFKSANLWSCSNWQTTACSTPGNPDPGGY